MKTNKIILLFLLFPFITVAQTITGKVSQLSTKEEKQTIETLPSATVYWAGTEIGTITDTDGKFKIKKTSKSNKLVASFVGCQNDTIIVSNQKEINFTLKDNATLGEVVVRDNSGSSYVSKLNTQFTTQISSAGLQKMACCNLSESFQNSAAVDVGYSDAVSGAKQIQMLGLAGIYSQILTENIPSFRGLASPFGLAYIPGSWMESIQVSKGTASVKNGYESVTGQINIELKKPEKSEPLFLNLYTNNEGRYEVNLTSAIKLNKKWSTMFLGHTSFQTMKMDENKDGFLDIPLSTQYNFANRWIYHTEKTHSILYVNLIDETRKGGQTSFYPEENRNSDLVYGVNVKTKRYQVFMKNGFMLRKPGTSIGWQNSYTYHNQNSFYGKRLYEGKQNTFYSNLLYETILKTTDHKLVGGVSYLYDNLHESLNDSLITRQESVPGIFMEYSYSVPDKLNIVLGLRTDYHNIYGFMITPRFHFKYSITKNTTLRVSAGKGYRSPNVIAENTGILSSSRKIKISPDLKQEEAWNYGINLTNDFELGKKRKASFTLDFYRTDFVNQAIVDLDHNVHEANFYNLNGKSYSNSFQAEFMIQPIKQMEITAAWRYNDVKATIDEKLQERPYSAKYKALVTFSYSTRFDKWKVDITNQFIGKSRLPNTSANPVEFQRNNYSPSYYLLFAQITRKFKRFDVYIGGENLTGYQQKNPVIDPQNPFSEHFDASMIWGPITKQMYYAGLRFTLK